MFNLFLSIMPRKNLIRFTLVAIILVILEAMAAYSIGPLIRSLSEISADEMQLALYAPVAVFVTRYIVSIVYLKQHAGVVYRFQAVLSNRVALKFLSEDVDVFEKKKVSLINQRIIKDTDYLREHYVGSILDLMVEAFVIIALLLTILIISPIVFALLLVVLVSAGTLYFFAVIRNVRQLGKDRQEAEGVRLSVLEKFVTSYPDLKQYGQVKETFRHFKASNNQLAAIGSKQKFLQNIPRATVDLVIGLFLVLLANPSSEPLNASLLPLFSISYVLYRIIPAAIKIANAYNGIFFSKKCLENITQLLEENLIGSNKSELELTARKPGFQVTYRDNQLQYTLGDSVKITGISGSGKTTLCRALVGMAKPQGLVLRSGDGVVFGKLANTIYLPQKPIVFPGSILENLFIQTEEQMLRTCELLVILKICAQSEALGFLDKNILSNSQGLSGGQTQRICLIRALLSDPKILILDEALSGVEQSLEAEIVFFIQKKLKIGLLYVSHGDNSSVRTTNTWEII